MNDCLCLLGIETNHFHELNIIGCFKLNTFHFEEEFNISNISNIDVDINEVIGENYKNSDNIHLNEIENTENEKDNRRERDVGFSLLSNRDQVTQYLKKTKFCQIMIEKGHCHREICNFAHSMDEFVFPDCAFKENCRKKLVCTFKHPHETIESYKKRTGFIVPKNIKE